MTRKAGPRGNRKRPVQAHDADLDLWRTAMADVKPLPGHKNSAILNSLSDLEQAKQPIRPNIRPSLAHASRAQDIDLEHGRAPGLDRRTQLRLRRGKVNIEARLDLHGMTQTAAHDALHHFLERAFMAGKKTVLVVTGKGLRADGRIGVLRQAVPQWLNTFPLRQWVHAFDHAAARDGGEGALYIVMRRQR